MHNPCCTIAHGVMSCRAKLNSATKVVKMTWCKGPSNSSTVGPSVTHNSGAAPQHQDTLNLPVDKVTCTQTHTTPYSICVHTFTIYMLTHTSHMHTHNHAHTHYAICLHTTSICIHTTSICIHTTMHTHTLCHMLTQPLTLPQNPPKSH